MIITRGFAILLCLIFLTVLPVSAQQLFSVTLKLTETLPSDSISVWLDDIRGDRILRPKRLSPGVLQITDTLRGAYAVIHLQAKQAPGEKKIGQTFFIGTAPAEITIHSSDNPQKPFAYFTLSHAFDFKADEEEMRTQTAPFAKKELDYYAANKQQLDQGNADLWKPFNQLREERQLAQLRFVVDHPDRYRSFYIFRSMLYKYKIVSPDSMMAVFLKFPDRFRHTEEGAFVGAYLKGATAVSLKGMAPDFKVKDIDAKLISLSDFRGKKMVLLHFWATWCGACVEEIPDLKALNEQFQSKDFQLISVAYPSHKDEDYLPVVKKRGMNWINIYNQRELTNAYGLPATPQLLLVDKTGVIVFDSIAYKDKQAMLQDLKGLLEKSR